MIFRGLFIYAIFRGFLDWVFSRPDVKRRILEVMVAREARMALLYFNPIINHLNELAQDLYLLSKKYEKEIEGYRDE